MNINARNFWPRQGGHFLLTLGTHNLGKVKEMQAILAHLPLQISALPPDLPEAEENGLTFEDNAIIKARYALAMTGQPSLADDSGLEADALGGAPGVHSARYADDLFAPEAWQAMNRAERDRHNLDKLLAELKRQGALHPEQRKARFRCCMALALPGDECHVCHGTWEGVIAPAPQGVNGFGYDPVFLVPQLGASAAMLAPARKDELSHRGKALRAMMEKLAELGIAPS